MTKLEKVDKALSLCKTRKCNEDCPYYKYDCFKELTADAYTVFHDLYERAKENGDAELIMTKLNWVCTRCRSGYTNIAKLYRYCPTCGARFINFNPQRSGRV